MSALYRAAELLVEEAHHFLRELSFLKLLSELKTEHRPGCHDSSNGKYGMLVQLQTLPFGVENKVTLLWILWRVSSDPLRELLARLYSQSWMRIVHQQQNPRPRPCLSKQISKSCFVRGSHCQDPALQQARVVNKEELWKWNWVTATRVVAAEKDSLGFVYQHLSKSHLPPTKTWVNCDDW